MEPPGLSGLKPDGGRDSASFAGGHGPAVRSVLADSRVAGLIWGLQGFRGEGISWFRVYLGLWV